MRTRVLFINTPFPREEHPVPPLGLTYLAAVLEKEGMDVHILDLLVEQYSPEKLRRNLQEYRPQFVAATCSTLNYGIASRILKVCKNFDASLVTLIGGPHVSFVASQVIEKAPWIDFVVRGEGEYTLGDLLHTLVNGKDLREVLGIAFRRDGKVILTPPRPLIKELDKLPLPARHLLPLSKYRALKAPTTVITSRGCPFGCIFCSAPKMFGRGVRFRNPKLVVDEIEMIYREFGFEQINIVDDTFTVKEQHVQSICDGLMARGIKIRWSVYSRVDTISPRLLSIMKEAGCSWVCFGLESGSQEILDRIKKGITIAKSREAVRMAKEAGINTMTSFMLGLPGENPETASQTVELAKELFGKYGVSYGFHILAPMPGTEVCEKADEYGIRILTHNWAKYDANRPVAETTTFSAAQMIRIVEDYEYEINEAWKEMKSQAECGNTQLMERVAGIITQDFVWKMLKSDAIERVRRSDGHQSELARKISKRLDVPLDLAEQELAKLIAAGNITRTKVDGEKRPVWKWA